MDVVVLANFLLFLGAFGVSLASNDDEETPEDSESRYDEGDYQSTSRLGNGDDDVTASGDNLAWFMNGGNDDLTASSGADFADLGTGDDSAAMGAGNDIVEAGAGADSVSSGNGNDLALGGSGNDNIFGDLGDDSLGGDDGDDDLFGGSGADILSGGLGNDVISGFSSVGGATGSMFGADGIDQLFGGAGDDHLMLGRGDSAAGGSGADTFELDTRWRDGSGLFTLSDYQAGEDEIVISYAQSYDPNTSAAVTPTVTVRPSADGLSSVIVVNGTAVALVEGVVGLDPASIRLEADTETDTTYRPENFDETLDGTAAADTATGTAGEDYGRFGAGNDTVAAGDGQDSLLGEDGDDALSGDAGNDTLIGGAGEDDLDGGAGADAISGDTGDDIVTGGAGADRLLGGAGSDTLSGFDADGAGGTAATIDGADTLTGGDGDDLLITGKGDIVAGGAGEDTFQLDGDANVDASAFATIQDYVRATDDIELHYTPVLNALGVEVPPTVTVIMGPSNAYAVIMFNGAPLAHVTGASTLTLADITLVRQT